MASSLRSMVIEVSHGSVQMFGGGNLSRGAINLRRIGFGMGAGECRSSLIDVFPVARRNLVGEATSFMW